MEYISTRNNKKTFQFKDVFIKGLADDGGLFIPKSLHKVDINELRGLDYKDLAKKVTYKEFESDFMMALNFGDNKSQQALNMAQNNHFMKSIEKCMTLYPEALDSPFYDKKYTNEEIEALAQNHLIEIKNEIGIEEYNELMKLVNLENYSKCFMRKIFTEFKVNEMFELTIEQQIRVEELRNICLTDNLRE